MISCCNKHFKEKKEGTERTVGQGEIGKEPLCMVHLKWEKITSLKSTVGTWGSILSAEPSLGWGGEVKRLWRLIVVLVLSSEEASQRAQGSVCVVGPWVFGRLGTYRTKCKSLNSCITPSVFMEQYNCSINRYCCGPLGCISKRNGDFHLVEPMFQLGETDSK